ncbi:TetR/AcrR family transcriptional regulator [Zobellia roscoffensis]|uniref:TetR/AcrR family transcriptional regulator n=1 Tax=Zobellia roscoffensis TaxID=2779508 RepID=UPI00188D0105|nr:TetR/AcrR family transcriptional regulator [Zobellia roscoffensis]
MPRVKKYCEEDVVDKAMSVFWRNGYNGTSMQMLEKEMGINKFSIYSSFGNKHGVFVECLKAYNKKTNDIYLDFKNSEGGINDIKKMFYNFLDIWFQDEKKGCFMTNTHNEFVGSDDKLVMHQVEQRKDIKDIIIKKLKMDSSKTEETVLKEASFISLSLHSLPTTSRVSSKEDIKNYIEMVFKNI